MSVLRKNIIKKIFSRILIALVVTTCCCVATDFPVQAKTATKQSSTKKSQSKKTTSKKKSTGGNSSAKKNSSGTTKSQTTRKSGEVRQEKQRTEKEIADTKKKLTDNEKRTRSQLDQLSNLDSQIERQQNTIDDLTQTIDELQLRSDILTDSIASLLYADSLLRVQIAEGLRHQHVRKMSITPLAFVTSASTVSEMRQRMNYLNVVQRAQNKQVAQLRSRRRNIEKVRYELDSVQANHSAALKQLSTAKNILDNRRRESERLVNDLRKEGASLNKVLQDKQRRLKQLDDELNRLILEEQRRAEQERNKQSSSKGSTSKGKTGSGTSSQQGYAETERALTGSFDRNKGKLLFPVAGKYTITGTFGRSQHSQLNHVQVDNSGIDISVAAGTKARAVFDGTVSSIFFMDGFENIIIVRHGRYLTVYAGLSSINVRKGEAVKSGQTLGTIATADGNTTLHFEVRDERAKLNPLDWVK